MRLAELEYDLPEDAVAQVPREPRDEARLLVVPGLEDRRFRDLPDLLGPGDLLVVNRTRVRAARLRGRRAATGGAVEALLTQRTGAARWEALVRPARRLRAGAEIRFGPLRTEILREPRDGVTELRFVGNGAGEEILAQIGELPLPPYFHGTLADPERYQTIFADRLGSTAAPTAGLHFTPELLTRLAARQVHVAPILLYVGIDTFRPLTADPVEGHRMHREWYEVPVDTVAAIATTRARGGRVVAVGTTVVRALETAARSGSLEPGVGESDLFVLPGYRCRIVDALVTNFHAPRTTLLAMIAALVGPDWREVYEVALARGYRFLSFGDAMLVTRVPR